MIARTIGLIVDVATLSTVFNEAVAMAYLTSKRLNAVNHTHSVKIRTEIAIETAIYGFPLTRKEALGAETVTIWWEFTKETVTTSIASKCLNVVR